MNWKNLVGQALVDLQAAEDRRITPQRAAEHIKDAIHNLEQAVEAIEEAEPE
jgi:hypothetical protein